MLRIKYFAAFLLAAFTATQAIEQKRIVVVVASYNNARWYKWNLDSLFKQNYSNYYIIYIDDCSTDNTGELVQQYVQEKKQQTRVKLIRNQERLGALANQYKAIHSCDPQDIIIICDGDDALNGNSVLAYINKIYQNPKIWMTYGQFLQLPSNEVGFCREYPFDVIQSNSFRNHRHIPSHLRTFYAGLFQHIQKEDLMENNKFFEMTGDMAAMVPMIEMACDHHKFISEILYLYNQSNPISDHRKSRDLQERIDLEVRKRKPYEKITDPFDGKFGEYRK